MKILGITLGLTLLPLVSVQGVDASIKNTGSEVRGQSEVAPAFDGDQFKADPLVFAYLEGLGNSIEGDVNAFLKAADAKVMYLLSGNSAF